MRSARVPEQPGRRHRSRPRSPGNWSSRNLERPLLWTVRNKSAWAALRRFRSLAPPRSIRDYTPRRCEWTPCGRGFDSRRLHQISLRFRTLARPLPLLATSWRQTVALRCRRKRPQALALGRRVPHSPLWPSHRATPRHEGARGLSFPIAAARRARQRPVRSAGPRSPRLSPASRPSAPGGWPGPSSCGGSSRSTCSSAHAAADGCDCSRRSSRPK
jgi:hypothetical protein